MGVVQGCADADAFGQVGVGECHGADGDDIGQAVLDVLDAGGDVGAGSVDQRCRPQLAEGVQEFLVAAVGHVRVGELERHEDLHEGRVQLVGAVLGDGAQVEKVARRESDASAARADLVGDSGGDLGGEGGSGAAHRGRHPPCAY